MRYQNSPWLSDSSSLCLVARRPQQGAGRAQEGLVRKATLAAESQLPWCRCKNCCKGGDREVGAERGEEQCSVASFPKNIYLN